MAMENKPRHNKQTGEWTSPSTEEVLKEVGLFSIEHYIRVRRDTVAQWIVDRPIFDYCERTKRRRGTSHRRQFWWEQPMTLELESEED